jgi:hypothetical protein
MLIVVHSRIIWQNARLSNMAVVSAFFACASRRDGISGSELMAATVGATSEFISTPES